MGRASALVVVASFVVAMSVSGFAQSVGVPQASSLSSTATTVPRLIRVTSTFVPANGQPSSPVETVTLALYAEATGGLPLWQETQTVAIDADGRYALLLGATLAEGLPQELFASGEARWLGRRFDRAGESEQARVLLASVPYALKASDADTIGGRPATDFLLSAQGQTRTNAGTGQAAGAATQGSLINPASLGTPGRIGRFFNSTDLGDSAMFESGGLIGLGTTAPLDNFHVQFMNTNGGMTGYAVQNLGNTATSYSGMLFYDQNGVLGQFQGFNNSTHEYRVNNIASGGTINFMIGGSSKFLVNATGAVAQYSGVGVGNALDVSNGAIKVSGTNRAAFQHTATAGNITANYTTIDNPMTNGDPNAVLVVTPVLLPPNNQYANFPIGVWYSNGSAKWTIFNQNSGGGFPVNAAFNVLVIKQ